MHGGNRKGAGRKKGFAAKDAEEARRYLSHRVSEEIQPLAEVLIQRARKGGLKAFQILLDRAWGRPRQEIQLVTKDEKTEVSPRIRELARLLNYGDRPLKPLEPSNNLSNNEKDKAVAS